MIRLILVDDHPVGGPAAAEDGLERVLAFGGEVLGGDVPLGLDADEFLLDRDDVQLHGAALRGKVTPGGQLTPAGTAFIGSAPAGH